MADLTFQVSRPRLTFQNRQHLLSFGAAIPSAYVDASIGKCGHYFWLVAKQLKAQGVIDQAVDISGTHDMAPVMQAVQDHLIEQYGSAVILMGDGVYRIGSSYEPASDVTWVGSKNVILRRAKSFAGTMIELLNADDLHDFGIIGGVTIDGNRDDIAISSITRSGTTATVTTTAAHGLTTGQKVGIVGTVQREYSSASSSSTIKKTITVTGATTFTYPIGVTTSGIGTGSISGTTLTVTGWTSGRFQNGFQLSGTGITGDVRIVRQITNTDAAGVSGKNGTYQVSASVSSTGSITVTAILLLTAEASTSAGIVCSPEFGTIRIDSDAGTARDLKFSVQIKNYSRTGSGISLAGVLGVDLDGCRISNGGCAFLHAIYFTGCGDVRLHDYKAWQDVDYGGVDNGVGAKLSGNSIHQSNIRVKDFDIRGFARGINLPDLFDVRVSDGIISDCGRGITVGTEQSGTFNAKIWGVDFVRCGSFVTDSGTEDSAQSGLGALDVTTIGRDISVIGCHFFDCPVGVRGRIADLVDITACHFLGTDVPVSSVSRTGDVLTWTFPDDDGSPTQLRIRDGGTFYLSGASDTGFNTGYVLTKVSALTFTSPAPSGVSGTPSGTLRFAGMQSYRHAWITDASQPRFAFHGCTFKSINNGASIREGVYSEAGDGIVYVAADNVFNSSTDSATAWTARINSVGRIDGWDDTAGTVAYRTNTTNGATLTPQVSAPVQVFTGTLANAITVTLATTKVGPLTEWVIKRTGGGAFNLNIAGTGFTTFNLPQNYWVRIKWDPGISGYIIIGYGQLP